MNLHARDGAPKVIVLFEPLGGKSFSYRKWQSRGKLEILGSANDVLAGNRGKFL
jgi:hypothetical protein